MKHIRIPCSLSIAIKPVLIVSNLSAKRSLWVKTIAEGHYQTYDCSYDDFVTLSRTVPFEFSLLICDTENYPWEESDISRFFHDVYQNTPAIFIGTERLHYIKRDDFPEYLIGTLPEFDKTLLMPLVYSGLKIYKTIREKIAFSYSIGLPMLSSGISGRSSLFQNLSKGFYAAAANDAPVFIDGERGCGKDFFAAQIHQLSRRKNAPFNVAPANMGIRELYEPYLFGIEPNTDEIFPEGQIGKLEMLNHGTVFVDNIDLIPKRIQEKFLAYLKTGLLYRLNSVKPITCDTRVIVSCSRKSDAEFEEGLFPFEWKKMFSETTIRIPSLRECPDDIPFLVNEIARRIDYVDEKTRPQFSHEAIEKLKSHSWPENVDELSIVVRRAIYTNTTGVITPEDIIFSNMSENNGDSFAPFLGMTLNEIEKRFINETLQAQQGNRSAAAKILGISQKTLYNKLKGYDNG